MGITCPACGSISQDVEFCDHCNADLLPPGAALPPARCPLLPDETVPLTADQVEGLSRPEASLVLKARGQSWRIHWIARDAWSVWQPLVEERLRCRLPVLPPCRLIEEETGFWVAVETTGQTAAPWSARIPTDPINDLRRLLHFLGKLEKALEPLHARQLVWLTFDPLEIEKISEPATSNGGPGKRSWLRFTNLDLAIYPAGRVPERLQVRPAFAAPEVARFQASEFGPATDVFHLALFSYYWLAGLLPQGFPGKGLEAFGHALPPLRILAPALPPGISGVLERGLALEPKNRFPTPTAFVRTLEEAWQRAEKRWSASAPVHWEIGKHSRTGRAKSALQRENEDAVLVREFADPSSLENAQGLQPLGPGAPGKQMLVAVADGITSCDVGSGALASMITCLILENVFADPLPPEPEAPARDPRQPEAPARDPHQPEAPARSETFARRITEACRRSSESLLAWAMEKGYGNQLAAGRELMGSTLLAGWLEGNTLSLANVGDSRAYLVDGFCVEQLTVDGDLAGELLAAGVAPEEVKGLGSIARGLRNCVGGCSVGPQGEVKILDEFCLPVLSRWPLLPGDVVILCSDGLVEEGAFLEPEKLGELVRSQSHLSPQALAESLAEAADALQRLPSPLEPDGFGDNITCIVIKVSGP